MRIAIAQKKIGWSGQSIHVFDLAVGLRERGHDVHLISQIGSGFSQRARAAGFTIDELNFKRLAQLTAVGKIALILRARKIDVLHCHDPRDHQVGCFAAMLAGTRALIRTKHNAEPLRNFASRIIHGRLTSHLISVSEFVKQSLVSSGIAPDSITTVYNFVDLEKFSPREPSPQLRRSLGIPDGAPIVGTTGRMHRYKGTRYLVESIGKVAGEFPDVRFLFVGGNPGNQFQWQRVARELVVDRHCVFPGFVPNVEDYLALMDVAVFPTLAEPFGLAILEAMAMRRAVVGARAGALPEIIREGANGVLVEPANSESIADAVLVLLRDARLRERLGAEARKAATETFTRDNCLAGVEDVYRRALAP